MVVLVVDLDTAVHVPIAIRAHARRVTFLLQLIYYFLSSSLTSRLAIYRNWHSSEIINLFAGNVESGKIQALYKIQNITRKLPPRVYFCSFFCCLSWGRWWKKKSVILLYGVNARQRIFISFQCQVVSPDLDLKQ